MIGQTKMQVFQNHYLEKEKISFIWANLTNMVAIIFFPSGCPHLANHPHSPCPRLSTFAWPPPLPPPPLMCRHPLWMAPFESKCNFLIPPYQDLCKFSGLTPPAEHRNEGKKIGYNKASKLYNVFLKTYFDEYITC